MKAAIILFSGPESACKLTHAFVFARDIQARGGEAKIVFEGASPAWLLELPNPEHKLHGTYQKVKNEGLIDAVCKACAKQANAVEAVENEGLRLSGDAFGHVSLSAYITETTAQIKRAVPMRATARVQVQAAAATAVAAATAAATGK